MSIGFSRIGSGTDERETGLVAVQRRPGAGRGRCLVQHLLLYAAFGVASMVLKSSRTDNVRDAEDSSV